MYFIDVVVCGFFLSYFQCFLSFAPLSVHFIPYYSFILLLTLRAPAHSFPAHSNCLCMYKWQIKISWFLIYDLHYSHNTPVCGPLDQDQLSNNFLVTSTPPRLVSLAAALCCLLSDYGNVILTLGNAIVQQTVKIDNLRFACMHQHERHALCRRADETFCCVQPC